jgi:hypothetical protein
MVSYPHPARHMHTGCEMHACTELTVMIYGGAGVHYNVLAENRTGIDHDASHHCTPDPYLHAT